MDKRITNVVFDFGGVVAPADIALAQKNFRELGVSDIEKYLNLTRQEGFFGDFEEGLIDEEGFRCKVSEKVGHEVSTEACRQAYLGFFSTVPEANLKLFERLRAEGYRLSLLSNTNSFVSDWFLNGDLDGKGRALDSYLDNFYLSYRLKTMKPDERIFKILLDSENAEPEAVLFIDDGPRNVAAAAALGIRTLHVTDPHDWTSAAISMLEMNKLYAHEQP